MIALSVAALGGLGYGKYESAKYDAYVSKAEAAAKEQEVKQQSSSGWVISDAGELVANLQPGEENTRPFLLKDGQSTPWIVIPPDHYDFRFTNLQAVIVEWNGQRHVINPP